MDISELKKNVEAHRELLKKNAGKIARARGAEHDPASMGLIDGIVAVLEEQDRRIADLEKRGRGVQPSTGVQPS